MTSVTLCISAQISLDWQHGAAGWSIMTTSDLCSPHTTATTGPPPARTGLVRPEPCSGETNPTALLNYVWIINVSQLSLHSLLAGHRIHTKSSWFGGTAPAPATLYSSITNHANQNNKRRMSFILLLWFMIWNVEWCCLRLFQGVDGILECGTLPIPCINIYCKWSVIVGQDDCLLNIC